MDKEFIRQMFPERPRPGLLPYVLSNCEDELGVQYLVWRPETVPIYGDLKPIMTAEDWKPVRHERLARCTCLQCGSDFHTEVIGGTLQFFIDECGEVWPIDPSTQQPNVDDDTWEAGYSVEINDGENLRCPMCESDVYAISHRRLRGGRRKQILVASVEVVDTYTAVIYWLVYRDIYDDGNDYGVRPRDAYVLDEKGRLVHYSHTSHGGYSSETDNPCWTLSTHCRDSADKAYHNWGSINNRKKGEMYWDQGIPDLTGTTGEKTGLQTYAQVGLAWVEYLKLWRKYRNLENLVNTGWTALVNRIACLSFEGHDALREMARVIDISKSRPAEMLGLSRADFKMVREQAAQWDYDTQILFRQYSSAGIGSTAQFLKYRSSFGTSGLRAAAEIQRLYGDADIAKLERYMNKQNISPRSVGLLLDTRNASRALAGNRPLTQEELWPRNLHNAHDRLTRLRVTKADPALSAKYQKGFDEIRADMDGLLWSDGDLCVVLPTCNDDLVREGDTLRHCVGGYGADHISRHHVIFFIRHYRRPERSYYTLDINMIDRPYRQQLHGYGNERHGIHKQYSHKIPKKVLDFCDRWEKEVLMPWYRERQKQAKLESKGVSA